MGTDAIINSGIAKAVDVDPRVAALAALKDNGHGTGAQVANKVASSMDAPTVDEFKNMAPKAQQNALNESKGADCIKLYDSLSAEQRKALPPEVKAHVLEEKDNLTAAPATQPAPSTQPVPSTQPATQPGSPVVVPPSTTVAPNVKNPRTPDDFVAVAIAQADKEKSGPTLSKVSLQRRFDQETKDLVKAQDKEEKELLKKATDKTSSNPELKKLQEKHEEQLNSLKKIQDGREESMKDQRKNDPKYHEHSGDGGFKDAADGAGKALKTIDKVRKFRLPF